MVLVKEELKLINGTEWRAQKQIHTNTVSWLLTKEQGQFRERMTFSTTGHPHRKNINIFLKILTYKHRL